MKHLLLAALVLAPLAVPGSPRTLSVEIVGNPSPDQRGGIELGGDEMAQTARLLGANVTISFAPDSAQRRESVGAIVCKGGAEIQGDVPVIVLTESAAASFEDRCRFQIPPSEVKFVSWLPSLTRFGAAELNERFTKRFGRPMTSDAWNGWFAVKVLVETALRGDEESDLCAALLKGRFDGHKGRQLSFDPDTHILRQPLYSIAPGGVVEKE